MAELNTNDTEKHCRELELIGVPEEIQVPMLERFIATFEFEEGENATHE